jgi:hypothetical protein
MPSTMGWAILTLSIITIYLAGKVLGMGESRIKRSITIRSSTRAVFGVVSRLDQIPEWHRGGPSRLGRCFRLPTFSTWGEYIPSQWLLPNNLPGRLSEIRIRSLADREFYFENICPGYLHYESTFRIASRDDACVLTWVVRYRTFRWIDALMNSPFIRGRTYDSMGDSLETIRRMAERDSVSAAVPSYAYSRILAWKQQVNKAS